MRILEIKNNLVKISYDVNDNLALSGFAVIEDTNCPYVAQIVNLKADGGNNYAILKLLFTFDENGILKSYNGTIPSENAEITPLPAEEILNLFNSDSPIYIGDVAGSDKYFNIDLDVFTSGLLICSSSILNTGKLLSNIFPQIVKRNKKVILIDTTGDYYTENSFVFGKNFKLPLNAEFLDYIFDNDLEGVEPVSKAVIQDIFSEVKEYLFTLPQGYLPIDLFINVVQEQYAETRMPELVLLKNKLMRYKENNVFASGNDDIYMLRSKIAHTDSLIVDVSQVDNKLVRKLINYVYDTVATVDNDTCAFITMTNDIADKKLLRKTMEYGNIFSTIICAHEFKYLPDLKQIIPNMILFAPQTQQHDFAGYNTFLSKLNGDEFIIYGEFTQKIPFIIQLTQYDENVHYVQTPAKSELEEVEEKQEVETAEEIQTVDEISIDSETNQEIEDFTDNDIQDEELIDDNESSNEIDNEETSVVHTENVSEIYTDNFEYQNPEGFSDIETSDDFATESDLSFYDENENNLPEGNSSLIQDDFMTEPVEEENSNDNSFEEEVLSDREILEEQVANDIDASLYKKIEDENLDDEDKISPEVLVGDDEITDEELDYIEKLNSNTDSEDNNIEIVESENNEISEAPSAKNEKETDVSEKFEIPIYTPDEFTKIEPDEVEKGPQFKAGDVISHPKYGQGVVEKMINYGNKTLCSINFVNLGRRLLDPSISDLELVGRDGAVVE